MLVQCERCKQERECTFVGESADPEQQKSQLGEWLCDPCLPLRLKEVRAANEALKSNIEKARKWMGLT